MALQAGRVGVHPSQVDLLGKIKMLPFIKKIAPWQSKGKWYKVRVTSDGETMNVTGDLPLSVYTYVNNLLFDVKFNVCLVIPLANDIGKNALYNFSAIRTDGTGKPFVVMPSLTMFSYIDLYIFGFVKDEAPVLLSDEQPVQSVRKVAKASKVDEPVEESTEPIEEPINTDTE